MKRWAWFLTAILCPQVVYKNNDVRLELSRLAKQGDPKMKIHGVVAFKCENVATLDPITFETPESFISLPKWNAKKTGSISFDFRTTEPNGLILFSHGKPRHQKDAKHPQMIKVDFFAIEMLDGHLYLLLDMGSGTIKIKALQKKVNDGEWYHVDFQRDGRSGNLSFLLTCLSAGTCYLPLDTPKELKPRYIKISCISVFRVKEIFCFYFCFISYKNQKELINHYSWASNPKCSNGFWNHFSNEHLLDNQVPNLARHFILNLKMTKFRVPVLSIIAYIIGCLEVPEVANTKYEKKKIQQSTYKFLSVIFSPYFNFCLSWVCGIKNTLINAVGFQEHWQNSSLKTELKTLLTSK